MIVCKFGGTSVADAAAINRLVGIIAQRVTERPLVVVSALAGVTDALLDLCRQPPPARGPALDAVLQRHERLAVDLDLPAEEFDTIRQEAAALGTALTIIPDLSAGDTRDRVAGHGELWSSRLVTAALRAAGLDAVWVDVRPVIRTDDRFTAASPDLDGLPERARAAFEPPLAAGRIPVTQGFLGATADGRPTTLGRGGSDYTATLLGAALRASRVEIWTDVDGIMTADPRIVPEARLLRVASHHEAAELAAFGARVLHPATQAPLVEAGIPCVVLNSFAPERPGTTVVAGIRPDPVGGSPVRAITCKRGITVLNIRSPRMLGATGFLRRLFEVFEQHGVSVDVVATSEVSVSVTLDNPGLPPGLLSDLERFGTVTAFCHRAIIAVVGIDLRDTSGVAARVFGAVGDINVEVISQGASAINVTFVVRDELAQEAVRRLHREFFGPGAAAEAAEAA